MTRQFTMVPPRIWTNERFQDLPDYLSQLTMMYLLTGPDVTSAGCYRVSKRYLEFSLALERGTADRLLAGLADTLLIGYDRGKSVVYVREWFQHCPPTSGKHACGIVKRLVGLRSPLVLECLEDVVAACALHNFKLPKAFGDTVSQIRETLCPDDDRVSADDETLSIPNAYTETETETDTVFGGAPLCSAPPKTDSEGVSCTVDGGQPVDNSGGVVTVDGAVMDLPAPEPVGPLPAFLDRNADDRDLRDVAEALARVTPADDQGGDQEQ